MIFRYFFDLGLFFEKLVFRFSFSVSLVQFAAGNSEKCLGFAGDRKIFG